jgi:3-dehydroquinate synthase
MDKINDGDAIIVDEVLCESYIPREAFENNIFIVIKAGEENKEYSAITKYIDKLINGGFRRGSKIYAIGGGVIQDISGFIASVLYRGVEWVFYPTTLLAQGDSCIGGKSSINFGKYKNQIGGFYPPHQIIIDTEFLNTCNDDLIDSGMGEMAHYFMIEGGGEFEFFKNVHYNENTKKEIITRSLAIKKKMIEIDEFDKGPRLVFNYGHSFGHVIESMTNYRVPHGISVAHGMDMANYVSWKLGISNEETYLSSKEFLMRFWGGYEIKNIMVDFYNSNDYFLDNFIELLKKDKKNTQTHLGLILSKEPGNVFKKEVLPDDNFKNILKEYSKQK